MNIPALMHRRAALTAQVDAVPTDLVRQDGCRRRSTQDYLCRCCIRRTTQW